MCVCFWGGSEADRDRWNNDERGRHHLPSSKWRQRKRGDQAGGLGEKLPVTSSQHAYDPVSSQIILICYWNTTHPYVLTSDQMMDICSKGSMETYLMSPNDTCWPEYVLPGILLTHLGDEQNMTLWCVSITSQCHINVNVMYCHITDRQWSQRLFQNLLLKRSAHVYE